MLRPGLSGRPERRDNHRAFAHVQAEPADCEEAKLMCLCYGGTISKWSFARCCAGSDCHEDPPNDTLAEAPKTPLTAPADSTSSHTASDQATPPDTGRAVLDRPKRSRRAPGLR